MATTVRGDKLGTFKRKAFYLVDPVALTVRHGSNGRIIDINDLEYEPSDVQSLLGLLPDNVHHVDGKFSINSSLAPEPPSPAGPPAVVLTDGVDFAEEIEKSQVRESIKMMEQTDFSLAFKENKETQPVVPVSPNTEKASLPTTIVHEIKSEPLSVDTLDALCQMSKEQVGQYLWHLGKGTARSVRKALRNRGRSDLAAAIRNKPK